MKRNRVNEFFSPFVGQDPPVTTQIRNAGADGLDLLDWADPFAPDMTMSERVRDTMTAALQTGASAHYTLPIGAPELREAVALKLRDANGFEADPATMVLITPGSDSGLLYAMMPFLRSGDEVLVPDPSYPNNAGNVRLLGAVPVAVALKRSDGFQLDHELLAACVTERTRMIVITHPNNPTGTVFRRDCLERICEVIVAHDLILVCDQAFEDLVYDGIEFVSPATLPGMAERTLTVFSTSKGLGLSGFRVGYIAASRELMEPLHGGAVNVLGATNTLAQIGAVAALRDSSELQKKWSKLERRRRLAYEVLAPIPGTLTQLPESGVMTWLDVSRLGTSSEIIRLLLEDARVAVGNGERYGAQGTGHVRIVHGCYADDDRVIGACRRVAEVLSTRARDRGVA